MTRTAGELAEGASAARAVEAYERAWREADYDAYRGLVTDALARDLDVETREAFVAAAADHAEASAGLDSQVTGIDVEGDRASIVTTETSRDGGDHVIEKVLHRLVRRGGAWRVDAIEAIDA